MALDFEEQFLFALFVLFKSKGPDRLYLFFFDFMNSSEYDAIYSFFILHLDIAVLEISIFFIGGLGDDDVEHLAELFEVLDDLWAGD